MTLLQFRAASLLIAACTAAGWLTHAAALGAAPSSVAIGEAQPLQPCRAPQTPEELQTRLGELRAEYAPFLRSLPPPLSGRPRTPLPPRWRMKVELEQVTPADRGQNVPPWHTEELDDAAWQEVEVPEWRYGTERPRMPASSILWYRLRFDAAAPAAGRRVFLAFAGVEWEAEVWLNGQKLGSHKVYYEPFRFDVTAVLKPKNVLAVRVSAGPRLGEPIAYWGMLPDVPAEDQRYVRDAAASIRGFRHGSQHLGSGMGICREVGLETTGEACIRELFARGPHTGGEAKIIVEADAAAPQDATLDVSIVPENFEGRSYQHSIPCRLRKGLGRHEVAVPTPAAKPWSPDAPRLYRCRATLRAAGQTLDARDALFGFRSFEIVSKNKPRAGLPEGMCLLNGEPLFIRGTNVSPALNLYWYWKQPEKLIDAVLLLKAANFNAIRVCQHVNFPEVRELLDRLGMLSEQDQGGGRNGNTPEAIAELTVCGTALARACYNNPGVVLLSFGNETRFDPASIIAAVLAVDPQRVVKPISGNGHGSAKMPVGYSLPEPQWNNVIDDFHTYRGWYADGGKLWKLSQLFAPGRLFTVGEYGAEALDAYATMTQNYPKQWPRTPPADADELFGQVQVCKDDARQIAGFRGRRPKNLGQYIAASQRYQADVLAELTTSFRLSPGRIGGYFQFHFLDALPAHWPKSIVSHDLRPKEAYFEMAQVNQPLVGLFRLGDKGGELDVWVANDRPNPVRGGRIAWTIEAGGQRLLADQVAVDIPPLDAVLVKHVPLAAIPATADTATIALTVSDAAGRQLSRYRREVFLKAWRLEDASLRAER